MKNVNNDEQVYGKAVTLDEFYKESSDSQKNFDDFMKSFTENKEANNE